MGLIIAGERSGVGKTTITLALLSFLAKEKSRVQSFKVGPDYIDPMFHTRVTKRPCRNLDPVLTSPNYVKSCFDRNCHDVEYALVEGVMGLFDGIRKKTLQDFASTAHIARILDLPILLVIDCSRLSGSVAAIVHGYVNLAPNLKIAGLVLNKVGSDRHLELLQDALEPLKIPILGILRRNKDLTIPDRHLGLVPSVEINNFNNICERLANLAKNWFNWDKILPLLKTSVTFSPSQPRANRHFPVKIAVASDRAFNFYYQDNLDLLEQLGAKLIFWSPLKDEKLPTGVKGLYFGGGFPEIFARQLTENQLARSYVKKAICSGIPTIAECGGLMYLCREIIDKSGKTWPMVGILPTYAVMTQKLTLGYRQVSAIEDSLLFSRAQKISGHEFHYSQLTHQSDRPIFKISSYQDFTEGWQENNLHASYIHLHFGEYPAYLQRFLQNCFKVQVTTS